MNEEVKKKTSLSTVTIKHTKIGPFYFSNISSNRHSNPNNAPRTLETHLHMFQILTFIVSSSGVFRSLFKLKEITLK